MAQVLPATSPPQTSRSASPFLDHTGLQHAAAPGSSFAEDVASASKSASSQYYHNFNADISSPTSSEISSPRYDYKSSLHSTPPSSISLDVREEEEQDGDEEGLCFPTYGDKGSKRGESTIPRSADPRAPTVDQNSPSPYNPTPTKSSAPLSPSIKPADDTAVREEPSRQVDYLSHDWNEEDVSLSWRHVVANRRTHGELSRLENASWRMWTKSKYGLRTIKPERLNWWVSPAPTYPDFLLIRPRMKDCDVTWLYGPLQEAKNVPRRWGNCNSLQTGRKDSCVSQSEPASNMSKNNSFLKKPILKKRSVSEVMLQKSLSSSSLIRQAATAVQQQRSHRGGSRNEPTLSRSHSESTGHLPSAANTVPFSSEKSSEASSGSHSPTSGRKHIRFDNKVEQCIAVDFKNTDSPSMGASWMQPEEVSSSSEDDLVMMPSNSRRGPNDSPGSRRDSVGQDNKGIAMLPSTTLKYHHDEPNCPGHPEGCATPGAHGHRIQHSSSQETLRPSNPSTNFLLDDNDDDMDWEPSGAFGSPITRAPANDDSRQDERRPEAPSGLRRTPSGMFMPFEEEDEQDPDANYGLYGRVVNTVNTARDIFSVVYNVGWRS